MSNAPKPEPARQRLARAKRSLRSGLRRYPSAIVGSLRRRDEGATVGMVALLHEIAPHDLAVAWLGHAGVLSQVGDTVIAIDPVLSSRIGPRLAGRTIGLPRMAPPPLAAEALRGVDLLLLTHAHFDHLDKPTLTDMVDGATTVVAPPGCARLVPPGYAEVIELSAGSALTVGAVDVEAIAPKHWGARVAVDRHRGVNSYVVRSPDATVLFAGDTADTDAFDGVSDADVAVFGIGAYDPWEHMHATPEQVWSMFLRCGARYLLPVHHSTFELGDEPVDAPMQRLRHASGAQSECILECEPGEIVIVEEPSE